MANPGYDPTGTGKYGVGVSYNGVSGVNVLADGKISYGNVTQNPLPKPETPGNTGGTSSSVNSTTSSTGTMSVTAAPKVDVKVATPDIVGAVLEKAYSNEKVMQAFFEDMGLQEILSVTRNTAVNIVNGQGVLYQPIENMSIISQKYNSSNILPLQSAEAIYRNFSIYIEDKIVEEGDGTGPEGQSEYLDNRNNLVINIANLQEDERVEIETLSIENLFDGTIYEGDN